MMSTQVTLTLPDEVYRRASHMAQLTGRNVADVLAETIQAGLSPLGSRDEDLQPVSSLPDDRVLALSKSQMDKKPAHRMSQLLDRQQAGLVTETEQVELRALMQVYNEGFLRKTQALAEAVRRGLLPSLEP
jgi:hypothetical protein